MKLAFAVEFDSIAEAYAREKQEQGWGRAKREALICGDYAALPELARKDFESYRAHKQIQQAEQNKKKLGSVLRVAA